MAGGQGQRFWPLSTPERPKQFLDLESRGRTLIQATYDRVLPLAGSAERVLVATVERYFDLVREQLPELPESNILVEPTPRDSAPAVALAALTVHHRHGDVVTGFFSSDHKIGDGFAEVIGRAAAVADELGGLVTVGITPDRAATGYGYIELGEEVRAPGAATSPREFEPGHPTASTPGSPGPVYRVKRFVEKPSARTAEEYLVSGRHLWNAGIFVWRTRSVLDELDRHAPELMRPLSEAFAAGQVAEVFPKLSPISIDYALMERTDRAYVVPGNFAWDDIGDWVALGRLAEAQGGSVSGNALLLAELGQYISKDGSGNIIYLEDPQDVVVTLGVHDLVVVKRGNALLLVHKERVQEIKTLLEDERLVRLLEENGAKGRK